MNKQNNKECIKQQEDKRIYSINLISYVLAKEPTIDYEVKNDEENGKVYFVFKDNITDYIEEYRNNKELQQFLSNFRFVKGIVYNKRIPKA